MIQSDDDTPYRTEIRTEWADYNGHFNVAYYTLVLDEAVRDFVERRLKHAVGDSSLSITHGDTEYLREVKVGRTVTVDTVVLAVNDSAVHLLQLMREAKEGYLAAVEERIVCLRDAVSGEAQALPESLKATAAQRATDAAQGSAIPEGRPKLTFELGGNDTSNTD